MRRESAWPEVLDPRDPFDDPPFTPGPSAAWRHDRRRVAPAPWIPTVEDMLRIATDIAIGAGSDGPDRVLGPWADELDPLIPGERRALVVATAAMCFMGSDEDHRTPLHQWAGRHPVPPVEERAGFRAVEHAPWSIWRLLGREAGGWRVEDLVGMTPFYTPGEAPIALDLGGALVDPEPGDAIAARIVPTEAGWIAALAIGVRGAPPRALVQRWRDAELARRRPAELERMLRSDGHVLARRLFEWHWLRTHPAP